MFSKSKIVLTTVLIFVVMVVTGSYAAEVLSVNQSLEEMKQYIGGNLNMQAVQADHLILKAQYDETIKLYNESRKQTALLRNRLDRLNHDRAQEKDLLRQNKLLEKYLLQTEYYDVALLIKNLELSQEELEAINRRIMVEEEKYAQGDSTQLAVDNLKNIRNRVEADIIDITNRIEQGKNAVAARLNKIDRTQPNASFTIPVNVPHTSPHRLDTLKTMHRGNNLELLRLKANIRFHDILIQSLKSYGGANDPSYFLAVSEHNKIVLDVRILEQRIESFIETQYNKYRQSLEVYETFQERRAILDNQLVILSEKFNAGEISEVQYLVDRLSILTEINNAYAANAMKLNTIALINLIENGIMLAQ